MIIKPMVRGSICVNAHPTGCEVLVRDWIGRAVAAKASMAEASKASGKPLPKATLVLGCSTGYGLASRTAAAFSCGAATVGLSFEREPSAGKPASPGWYNNRAFDRAAQAAGLYSLTLNMDAYSDEARAEVIRRARLDGLRFDQVIYSLASPVRRDPKTGVTHRSALKPLGQPFSGTALNMQTGELSTVSVEPAGQEEAEETVRVMGGEDWELWLRALADADVLARGCVTVAYSYLGPEHTWPIYRHGTIGKAKEHLERTVHTLNGVLKDLGGSAYVSINKAVVTRASAVIPVIPLYVSALFKTMKNLGIHEDCVDQALRLYRERFLAQGGIPLDDEGRIRLDDWELRYDVQEETTRRMREAMTGDIEGLTDLAGFRRDFMQAHGFDVPGVDYGADVSEL